MTLDTYFQLSVGIFCNLATIFVFVFLIWLIMLKIQFSKLIKKLEEIVDTAKTTAGEAKDFVERTIQSLETFKNSIFTFDFIRRIITEAIELIKHNSKGVKNGQKK
jgi:hypothetical protein